MLLLKTTKRTNFVWSLIKSDRINALRKQYDTFLEEDKRRKERNEFILGRLDKMRYCTAMVQLRHKPSIECNKEVYPISPRQQENSLRISHSNRDFVPFNVSRTQITESALLQEISKKYILIPKNIPSFGSAYSQIVNTNVEDSTDWKSKYDILDKLKNNDKETDIPSNIEENYRPSNKNIEAQEKPQSNIKHPERDTEKQITEYKHEVPEKEFDSYEPQLYQHAQNQNTVENHEIKQDDYWDTTTKVTEHATKNEPISNITRPFNKLEDDLSPVRDDNESIVRPSPNNLEPEEIVHVQPLSMSEVDTTPENPTEWNNYNNQEMNNVQSDPPPAQNMIYDQYSPSEGKEVTSETANNVYQHENDTGLMNSEELVQQANNEVLVANSPQIQDAGAVEYPNDPANIEEYTSNENMELQDNVNINATTEEHNTINQVNYDSAYQYDPNLAPTENIENTVDTSGIEAFNAEQSEMFYSEQADQNYAYNQDDGANVYHQEYTPQNENYQENQENAYYEGADTGQVYSTENIEHEDTSQRYDPNYEQQYSAYDPQQEQQGYEQDYVQPQQYEGETVNEQEFQQMQFEQQHHETEDTIEQQLDNEQGYVEKQNEYVEINNVEKSPDALQNK